MKEEHQRLDKEAILRSVALIDEALCIIDEKEQKNQQDIKILSKLISAANGLTRLAEH